MIISIVGLLFLFIIPGFFLVKIFFNKESRVEKVILTIILSLVFSIILGLLLGFNEYTFKLTGGLNYLWIYYIVLNLGLLGYIMYKKRKKTK
jgi:uncharacterized membrane protein